MLSSRESLVPNSWLERSDDEVFEACRCAHGTGLTSRKVLTYLRALDKAGIQDPVLINDHSGTWRTTL